MYTYMGVMVVYLYSMSILDVLMWGGGGGGLYHFSVYLMYAYVERGVAVYIYCLRTLCLLMCVGGGDLYLSYVYLCGGVGGGGGLYL